MKLLAFAVLLPSVFSFTWNVHKYSTKSSVSQTTLFKKQLKPDIYRSNMRLEATIPLSPVPLILNSKRLLQTFFTLPLSKVGLFWRAIVLLCTAVVTKTRSNLKAKLNYATNAMEMGWSKRGTGSSFSRTVEVWIFAIAFLIKYVS